MNLTLSVDGRDRVWKVLLISWPFLIKLNTLSCLLSSFLPIMLHVLIIVQFVILFLLFFLMLILVKAIWAILGVYMSVQSQIPSLLWEAHIVYLETLVDLAYFTHYTTLNSRTAHTLCWINLRNYIASPARFAAKFIL